MAEKTRYHILTLALPETKTGDNSATPHKPETWSIVPETWSIVARNVEAHSANAAIQSTVKQDGIYVAIPSRSFTPTPVKLETTTIVKLGAAAA